MATRIIVLAAGRGTRMNPVRNQSRPEVVTAVPPQAEPISNGVNSETPKVLIPLAGKPLLEHLMDAIRASGIDPHPAIVVGENQPLIEHALGKDAFQYIRQDKPLGTGHAIACTEPYLKDSADTIIVLYGDHPFVSAQTMKNLHVLHQKERCVLSLMTVTVEDFSGWRAPFADFSRIIRDSSGRIIADVQVKDANPDELRIREVNPAFFCFDARWLWQNIKKIDNRNAKQEYYLTDLVKIAMNQHQCIASMSADEREAIGLNTPEHLKIAQDIAERRNLRPE